MHKVYPKHWILERTIKIWAKCTKNDDTRKVLKNSDAQGGLMVFQEQNFHEKNMKSHCKCVILSITLFSSQAIKWYGNYIL